MDGQTTKAGERNALELAVSLKQTDSFMSINCLTVFVPLEIRPARMNVYL